MTTVRPHAGELLLADAYGRLRCSTPGGSLSADRRFRVWIRPSLLALVALLVVIPVAMAWIETTV
jgi:hypothetical protein